MKAAVVFAALFASTLSGCLGGPHDTYTEIDLSAPSSESRMIVSTPDTFAVIRRAVDEVVLIAQDDGPPPDRRDVLLHVRVLDRDLNVYDQEVTIPPERTEGINKHPVKMPKEVPLPWLLVVDCTCPVVALLPTGLVNATTAAWPGAMEHDVIDVHVEYPYDGFGEDGVLSDQEKFALNGSVLHWRYFWENNLEGTARLLTPDGTELAYWESEGRFVTDGHTSGGYIPPIEGDWTLEMEGLGWFELQVKRYFLPHHTLRSLGFSV